MTSNRQARRLLGMYTVGEISVTRISNRRAIFRVGAETKCAAIKRTAQQCRMAKLWGAK